MNDIPLSSIVFFDIETVPVTPSFDELPENMQKLWDKKSTYFRKEEETAGDVYQRAGIYAEFGKIVCISVGHSSEFDVPYVARRMLVNRIPLPDLFDLAGKKPWEVKHLDTMNLWKFGDYKHFTSLDLLTTIFGIPTPKDDIDGSQVAGVYYKDKDIKRIAAYCEKDVLAVAQLYLRFQYQNLITSDNVEFSV
jgi:uncharacterized protein YprB with RNaseH-like and TPR domain